MTTPLVRLDIEGLRYQVLHAIAMHHKEVEEAVDAEMKRIIETFDFQDMIRKAVNQALQQHIESAIKNAMYELFSVRSGPNEIRDMLRKVVLG